MSFQPKSFWIPRDASCLNDGEMGCDNSSRVESKRGHPWYMDANGPDLFNNKKQAMEAVDGRPASRAPNLAVAPWDNTSGFQTVPGQFTDRPFGQEPGRTVNLVDRNIQSLGSGTINFGRKGFQNQYGNDQSVDLSMSHTIEDPSSCLSFGGIRKVKVNEVKDSDNAVSASMGHSYRRGDNNTISMCTTYTKSDENIISLSPPYNADENAISLATTFNKADDNFISVGHTFGKGDDTFISMAHNYSKGDTRMLSMGQPFEKENGSFMSIGQSYEKGDGSFISLGNSYNKVNENFISMGPVYGRGDDNLISVAPTYDKHADSTISIGLTYDKADSNILPMGPPYDKSDRDLPMSHSYNKNESNTISFGGFHDESETNPSGGIISSCGLLTCNQNTPAHASEESGVRGSDHPVETKMDAHVDDTVKVDSKTVNIPRVKEPKTKKAPPNNFPSNVKSLLSTGMFDGIPVKYSSWSREKNLDGIIKGTGYLCSCADCNHSKPLNAYDFERHAGAKTKHPNNHIYFENGKTIYAVVQELKNTPQDMLFDAIQNVTGSQINQKNFRVWKASFQAASRELQRIYGNEVAIPS
ncbi:uncharacterized protein LOC133717632 isoform X2 [Rosa rugosa]|uniref:uncharacterized protein LOC133717632 isoform X2 n=1 Tax=Rosa rugosa TaxID=74645 RepID=UPI002B41591B|nr:uncharacterized protein LOC133717632 isoform X2 [Rosa rugosa]